MPWEHTVRGVRTRWRELLPRALLAIGLLGLLLSLLSLQRAASESERRLAALDSAWTTLRGEALARLPDADNRGFRTFDGLLSRVREGGTPMLRAVGTSLVLALLVAALFAWSLVESGRRREARARLDDGRTRREQAAILRLLDEIAPLASGDLRVRATVSEAMTGALADAFNHAVGELRWLVGTVGASAARVDESVAVSREGAQRLVGACGVQAREIHRSSNHLNAMSDAMAQLAAQAAESSRIAGVSVSEAEAGARAIGDSVAGLDRIRADAGLATRLMQRLAENATAIDERVDTIRDVARRTDLLALNTTIRAAAGAAASAAANAALGAASDAASEASAGAAPSVAGDLSRLSDEVTQLADLLGGAARDIASLSRTIRQDAEETMAAMAATNRELGAGLALAERASGSLGSIGSVSRELQALVREMADEVLRQSGTVRQLSTNMAVINRITADTSRDVQVAAGSLDELRDLATELRHGVADFRLPVPPPPSAAGGVPDIARATGTAGAVDRVLGHG